MDNLTKRIVDKGFFSKYRIAKELGVSWNTVHMWYLGIFKPRPERNLLLTMLYKGGKDVKKTN